MVGGGGGQGIQEMTPTPVTKRDALEVDQTLPGKVGPLSLNAPPPCLGRAKFTKAVWWCQPSFLPPRAHELQFLMLTGTL